MTQPEAYVQVTPGGREALGGSDPLGPSEGFWALAGIHLTGAPPTGISPWRWFWAAQYQPPPSTAWVGYELRLALAPRRPPRLHLWVSAFAPDDLQADLLAEERLRAALQVLPQDWPGAWLTGQEIPRWRAEAPPYVGAISRIPAGRHGFPLLVSSATGGRPPWFAPWRPTLPPQQRAEWPAPPGPLWIGLAAAPTVLLPAEVEWLDKGRAVEALSAGAACGWRWWRQYGRPFWGRLRVGAWSPDALAWGLQRLRTALTWNASTWAWEILPQDEAQHRLAQVNWQRGTLHPWEGTALPPAAQRLPHLFSPPELAALTRLVTGGWS